MTEPLELNADVESIIDIIVTKRLCSFLKISRSHYAIINFNYAYMSIEQINPSESDRGNFKILADHKSEFVDKCYIDFSDAFPRYYFNLDCMIKEVKSWIEARPYLAINDIMLVNNEDKISIKDWSY